MLNVLLLQIHAHYELKKSSRHRKNLAITGGVALSIITAPVIAAVSVGKKVYVCRHRQRNWMKNGSSSRFCPSSGIGVPIMLAYVYGVVPISLCRGGGCGVSRGKGRGVRIDFDDDDGPITGEEQNLVQQLWGTLFLFSCVMEDLLLLQWRMHGEP